MVRPEQDSAKDYYKTLGLSFPCSAIDIRKAFLDLARTQHPDKNPGREQEFQVKFQEITVAYDVLKEPSLKRIYDQIRPIARKPQSYQQTQKPGAPKQSAYAHTHGASSAQRAAAAAAGSARTGYDWSSYFDDVGAGYPRQAKTSPRKAPTAAKPAPADTTRPQSTYTKGPFPPSATKPGVFGKTGPQVNKATKPAGRPQTAQSQPKATPDPKPAPRSEPKTRPPHAKTSTKPTPGPSAAQAEPGWWQKSKSAYSTTAASGKFDPRTPDPPTASKHTFSSFAGGGGTSPFTAAAGSKIPSPPSAGSSGSARFTPGGRKAQEEYQWQSSRTAYQRTPLYRERHDRPLDSDRMDDLSSSASEPEHVQSSNSDSGEDYKQKNPPRRTTRHKAGIPTAERKTAVPVSRKKQDSMPHRAAPTFASTFTPVNPTPTPEASTRKFSFKFTPPPVDATASRRSVSTPHVASPLSFSKVPDLNFSSSSPHVQHPPAPAVRTPEKRTREEPFRDPRYADADIENASDSQKESASESEKEANLEATSDDNGSDIEPISERMTKPSFPAKENPNFGKAGLAKNDTQGGSKPAFESNSNTAPAKGKDPTVPVFEFGKASVDLPGPFTFTHLKNELPKSKENPNFVFSALGSTPQFVLNAPTDASSRFAFKISAPNIPADLLRDPKFASLNNAAYVAAYLKTNETFQDYCKTWLEYERKVLPLCVTDIDKRKEYVSSLRAHQVTLKIHMSMQQAHQEHMEAQLLS
ncbi:hypothetical protein BCR37DRAFT_123096 [Protomyces lactucae-debilis]|uniref:J domain-containing protein n=1 Tax=Protomyces lactucae-debilis TaxID=2754530 RepID=A0A1Y2F4E8_PROLT|nr:uncharacterized protein BCR37DRAFT_123096 [Protomyces lactucae-debilis]ORY77815.1 hypothetical protein BCR37DRAFT_123096 [Protomyces lactucae-debilis]